MSSVMDTPLNQVELKASHNSYASAGKGGTIPLATQIDTWNCQSVEIDIHQVGDGKCQWEVYDAVNYGYGYLSKYLQELATWAKSNPQHDVILFFSDLKNNPNSPDNQAKFPEEIDKYILQYLDRSQIYTPGDLLDGKYDTLLSAVEASNWPTLNELKGKFVFCWTQDADLKATYVETDLANRLCFCSARGTTAPSSDNYIFRNLHVYSTGFEHDEYQEILQDRRYITHGYYLNNPRIWSLGMTTQ